MNNDHLENGVTNHHLVDLMIQKEISSLFKYFLETLEDIKNKYPDTITQQKFDFLRKKILDKGNDCERNILQFLDYFYFEINKEKVQKVANQRISKKVIINSTISL